MTERDQPPAPEPLVVPAEGVPDVVDTADALAGTVRAFADGRGPVAVDAERASGFRYGQRAYLVQLRREGAGTALIDPIPLGDLSALSEALDGTEWVLHAASQDLPCLAEIGMRPARLFDTELAGRMLGLARVGLGPIVEAELGLSLAKEHSAADWSTRPLTESFLRYAALDVEVLVELRDVLEAKLDSAGKLEWARQEFETVRLAPPPAPRGETWRKGARGVRDQRGLAVVRELWETREQVAERADIAPGRILSVDAIAAAGRTKPRTLAQLSGMREFKHRAAARRLRTWSEAVTRALDLPDADLPPKRPPHDPDSIPAPRSWRDREPEAAARLEIVKAVVRHHAVDLNLPQENLLTPDFQRRLAWSPPHPADEQHIGDFLADLGARPWQVEQVAGRLAAGFADPDSVPSLDQVGSDAVT
ncbi:HRDC domain-containing protein [Pseudactinotalea sp.]|uniref:HRDC domain-containing protein n=1 Tax=Pseudactinotalea sp. TaxID=1926260 RepID=UPI003B3B6E84